MSIPVTLELGGGVESASDSEILTFSRLSGLRKVAVLFRSLALQDEASARTLLGSLNSMEQVRIKEELDSMGVLGADMVTDVLREFDVLCGIHKAYREGGVDGAISVGEKFLHKGEARRVALVLGSQNGVDPGFDIDSQGDASQSQAEVSGQVDGEGDEDDSGASAGEVQAEDAEADGEETLALADLEEKDLEDVVT
ncbi:MAG: hypothetical protein VX272_03675 [Planctomycetota bacterium]|nr:hypothetical protein [Planctomycetota bacterium]MEE3230115.1 hypothetical protein [Planctomycetota bacterium]